VAGFRHLIGCILTIGGIAQRDSNQGVNGTLAVDSGERFQQGVADTCILLGLVQSNNFGSRRIVTHAFEHLHFPFGQRETGR
jgi:hypothetical protein